MAVTQPSAVLKLATVYTRLFPMVASSDHISPLTGAAGSMTVLLSKSGAPWAAHDAGGVIAEVGHGVYSIVLTATDTNTNGDLAVFVTATGGDPTTFVDQVQPHTLNDLNIDVSGNATIASNIKKNAACPFFPFFMTDSISHSPKTGLLVAAQRNFGSGWAPCANVPSELGSGWYSINLLGADTNANGIVYRFTAPGADDKGISLFTQP